jgi:hypothetical protein
VKLFHLSIAAVCGFAMSFYAVAQSSKAEDKYAAAIHAEHVAMIKSEVELDAETKAWSAKEKAAFVAVASKGVTKCHMDSMREYSSELRNVLFAAVEKSGSVLEGKSIFEKSLEAEVGAGGPRAEEVKRMINNAVSVAATCMQKLANQ